MKLAPEELERWNAALDEMQTVEAELEALREPLADSGVEYEEESVADADSVALGWVVPEN